MPRITTNQIAMGVGTAGAMVDVSSYVSLGQGVPYGWGRQDEFRDVTPASFSFTLDNYDGRFTPGNASSPLATTVTEGMQVSWLLGARLVSGTILSIAPAFPNAQAPWAQVVIAVDDMLGNSSRKNLTNLPDDIGGAAGLYAYWPMNEDSTHIAASEQTSTHIGPISLYQGIGIAAPLAPNPVVFGTPAFPGLPGTSLQLSANAEILYLAATPATTSIPYTQSDIGFWGYWVSLTPQTFIEFQLAIFGAGGFFKLGVYGQNNGNQVQLAAGTNFVQYFFPSGSNGSQFFVSYGVATAFAAGSWTLTCTLYVNGVSAGSTTFGGATISSLTTALRQPQTLRFAFGDGSANTVSLISRLSHTVTLSREDLAGVATESARLQAINATMPEVTLDTLPSDVSAQPLGFKDPTGSALDAFNEVMHTEQGYIWTATTGTLLAPVEKVEVRSRQRPPAVTTSFDVTREIVNAPDFVRDITNMLSSVDVTGTNSTVTVTDAAVTSRVGSASGAETILNVNALDLTMWGQDRLIRGKNVMLRIASVTIDAMNTPTDRSADILSLNPGDRVRFTALPTAQLGFSTWDGWLIGAQEEHSLTTHTFQLFFAPVLPTTAIFDTNLFMSGGNNSLNASCTSGATTINVLSADNLTFMEQVGVPYSIVIDSEQMTVTAAGAPSAGVQALTVTRGQGGTTAAAHSAAAAVEVTPASLYAF